MPAKVESNQESPMSMKLAKRKRLFFISLGFTIPIFLINWYFFIYLPNHELILFLLTIPVQFYVGAEIYQSAWKALKRFRANMDTLLAIGTTAAFIYGAGVTFYIIDGIFIQLQVIAIIMTMVMLGRYLEARAQDKATRYLQKLARHGSEDARVITGDKTEKRDIDTIKRGDIVLVHPGETIPVDGKVIEGHSLVNESLLTGLGDLQEKQKGSYVFTSTINQNGFLKIETLLVGTKTLHDFITRLIQKAQNTKTPLQKVADSIAHVFTPLVIVISIATGIGWYLSGTMSLALSFQFALSVLFAASPAALALATPTAITNGIAIGIEKGIFLKNPRSLEHLYRVTDIIFEKSILTHEKYQVTNVISLTPKKTENDILQYAASIEQNTQHPIANSIVAEAKKRELLLQGVREFNSFPGQGVAGLIGGESVLVGSKSFLTSRDVDIKRFEKQARDIIAPIEKKGGTVVFLVTQQTLIGIIGLSTELKKQQIKSINQMKSLGFNPVLMTGDSEQSARSLAKKAGITDVISDITPRERLIKLRAMQNERKIIAFVGDERSDAPSLEQADVGIVISSQPDTPWDTSDIALLRGDLQKVIKSIFLSRRTVYIIQENLFWAFFYNIIAIPFAIIGFINPIVALALAMLTSLFIGLNSRRVRNVNESSLTR